MARLIELKMPRLDPLMEEGIVVEWLKKPGDVV
jgi:pyruvate/2-oxoglutarate dehydrogenase complex dihydrolipoamide acyltransferase (E2) component